MCDMLEMQSLLAHKGAQMERRPLFSDDLRFESSANL